MIKENGADDVIDLGNVTGRILGLVIEYCTQHVNAAAASATKKRASTFFSSDDKLKSFDAQFVEVDSATLVDLMLAARELNIKTLLDLTCEAVAKMLRGKTPEETREILHLKDDLTPEGKEELRERNKWAFV